MESALSESSWQYVCELDPETVEFPFVVEAGEEEIAIFRVGDSFHAIQRWCPHKNADLSEGTLLGNMVKCPLHGYIFRFDDGRGINCVGIQAQAYQVLFDSGRLKIRSIEK